MPLEKVSNPDFQQYKKLLFCSYTILNTTQQKKENSHKPKAVATKFWVVYKNDLILQKFTFVNLDLNFLNQYPWIWIFAWELYSLWITIVTKNLMIHKSMK